MAKFSEKKGTYAKIVRLKIQRSAFEQEGEMDMKKWKKFAAVLAATMALSVMVTP